MMPRVLKIHARDNVAVALDEIGSETSLLMDGTPLIVRSHIPAGHKLALQTIKCGDLVYKYGFPIGRATSDIAVGEHVHAHNLKTNLSGTLGYEYQPQKQEQNIPFRNLTFQGFRRSNGDVGIRNELWIVPTVGCVNGIADTLLQEFKGSRDVGGIDALNVFKHNYGCSQLGEDHENTRKILRDVVMHPNAGGVLVLGLGCENNQIGAFRDFLGDFDPRRVKFMEAQKVKDEISEGIKLLGELYGVMTADKRSEVALSELRVGLKCGGSDGFSGITANPLVGAFSDFLVAQGGTAVLTEVPEMFGAETLLMNRCNDRDVFEKTVHLINDFKDYFIRNGQPVYENPSPGNKEGGISTLEEKSLGCTQKGGVATVTDVLMYGDRIAKRGLNLLSAPGNDLVASTALAAAGCQIVLVHNGSGNSVREFCPQP